jgi:hypothetical protein
MRHLLLFSILFAAILSSCLDDENIDPSPSLQLTFSTDTVLFDTLLTARNSVTRRFRIFNRNRNAVEISSLRLGRGENSPYRFRANSFSGPNLQGLTIPGRDSVLVLVEVTIDPQDQNLPFLVKDSLLVEWNGNQRDVKLVAWGQDANFIDRQVLCDEVWTNRKPYVISRDLLVDSLCTLHMEAGTRVYIDNGVRILIAGSLLVEGDTANPVIIRNSRFDENYIQAPGQWDGIYFLEGSKANRIEHAIIENGQIGLRIGTPDPDDIADVVINNTTIRHMAQSAIQAFTSDVEAVNCLFYNSNNPLIFNAAGGNYTYSHCTIANSPNFFVTDNPAVIFADNLTLANNQQLVAPLNVSISNSIIYGRNDEELVLSIVDPGQSSLDIFNNLISLDTELAENITSTRTNFVSFVSTQEFNYQPDSTSLAIDAARESVQQFDLEGKARDGQPDIGAFEYQKN